MEKDNPAVWLEFFRGMYVFFAIASMTDLMQGKTTMGLFCAFLFIGNFLLAIYYAKKLRDETLTADEIMKRLFQRILFRQ